MIRENSHGFAELRDILLADVVLIFAFSFTLLGGVFGIGSVKLSDLALLLPIVALAVTLSFVLHELMHKFVAQHYGAIAGFRTSYSGLMITLVTGFLGFLIGIPGATMIYASHFTRKENGIVSLAGPLTNFAVFGAFLLIEVLVSPAATSYLGQAVSLTLFISILLAFFNMLPIFPLDGSKVLAWNKPVYFGTMGVIFVLMIIFTAIPLVDIAFMLIIALMFSLMYRHIL